MVSGIGGVGGPSSFYDAGAPKPPWSDKWGDLKTAREGLQSLLSKQNPPATSAELANACRAVENAANHHLYYTNDNWEIGVLGQIQGEAHMAIDNFGRGQNNYAMDSVGRVLEYLLRTR